MPFNEGDNPYILDHPKHSHISINQSIIYLFRITDIAQYDNKNMNSEQDTPGSWQAHTVAFKKKKSQSWKKQNIKYYIKTL